MPLLTLDEIEKTIRDGDRKQVLGVLQNDFADFRSEVEIIH